MVGTRSRGLLLLSVVLALAGCGGGGDSGGGSHSAGTTDPLGLLPDTTNTRLTAQHAAVSADTVEGTAATTDLQVDVETDLDTGLYVAFEETNGDLVERLVLTNTPNGVAAHLTLRRVPAGRYESRITVQGCRDQGCTQTVATALVVPVRLTVRPNLVVDPTVALSRTGQEAAPQVTVPVTIPDELKGQAIHMDYEPPAQWRAMVVEFDGAALHITTTQQRAGTYTGSVRLYAPGDSRYHVSTTITYTVLPPHGGELPLAVTPSDSSLVLGQGEIATRRIHLQRPSWTGTLDGPFIDDDRNMTRVQALGNDDYEVTFDASHQVPESRHIGLRFTAGNDSDTRETVYASFVVTVDSAYRLPGFSVPTLRTTTQPAELRLSTPVLTLDGRAARWTATTDTPWLRLTSASGTTGQTALAFEIDPARLPAPTPGLTGRITLALDRPGVPPLVLDVPVVDFIPRLSMASQQVLVGSSGWIHVAGYGFGMVSGDLLGTPDALKVSGARLVKAEVRADTRYLGDMSVLAVQVADAVPGQPITLRTDTPLLPTQVTVQVEAATRVPTGLTALPAGAYRPAQYAPGQNALYTAGNGQVLRWAHSGAAWQLTTVALPGVIDVALQPDESVLHALNDRQELLALDPVTLVERGRTLRDTRFGSSGDFDPNTPADLRALVYSADTRPQATRTNTEWGTRYTGVDWLYPSDLLDLTASPRWGGPGAGLRCDAASNGLVRSAGGQALLWVHPTCGLRVYRPTVRDWVDWSSSASPEQPVALSDDGNTAIARSGRVRSPDGLWRDLPAALPAGQVAGGYGLTADGRFAVVYGYRPASEAGGTRARDATLWLIDLQAASPVAQPVPLPDAVGCTVATTANACRHTATVSVAEGDRSAFVTGPTGMVAVSLGGVLDAPAAPQAQAQSLRTGQRRSIRVR